MTKGRGLLRATRDRIGTCTWRFGRRRLISIGFSDTLNSTRATKTKRLPVALSQTEMLAVVVQVAALAFNVRLRQQCGCGAGSPPTTGAQTRGDHHGWLLQ